MGRVTDAERAILDAGPLTIIHGDAQARNMRTGPAGEVALLDWEDVSAAPGLLDLAWLLTSSTDPGRWDEVIDAYGPADGLHHVLPAVIVQGLLSMTASLLARPRRGPGPPASTRPAPASASRPAARARPGSRIMGGWSQPRPFGMTGF